MGRVIEAGMVSWNDQAVYGSAARAVLKVQRMTVLQLVTGFRAVCETVEHAVVPMQDVEELPRFVARARAFCALHMVLRVLADA